MCFILNDWPGGRWKDRWHRLNLSERTARHAGQKVRGKLKRMAVPKKRPNCGWQENRSPGPRNLAVASCIFGNFGAVAAELHAAPAAGSVFRGVVKMQEAAFALAQATRIETGEHLRGRMQQRREKILGFPRLKTVLPPQSSLEKNEPRGQRVPG